MTQMQVDGWQCELYRMYHVMKYNKQQFTIIIYFLYKMNNNFAVLKNKVNTCVE